MKSFLSTTLLICLMSGVVFAQDDSEKKTNDSYTDLGAEIVSSYVWRGMQIDASPNVQAWGEYGISNFSFGIWASSNLSGSYAESDFYAGYAIGNLSVTLTDYFYVTSADSAVSYFNFDESNPRHAGELGLSYTISEKFPLQISIATFVFGADKSLDDPTKNNFSSYFELKYPLSHGATDIEFVLGGVSHESAYYGTSKAAITNIGVNLSKEIALTEKFKLPVSLYLTANPDQKSFYTVLGISF